MTQEMPVEKDSEERQFMKKHWNMVVVFIVAGVLAVVGAVYVFLWFVATAQSTGLVPTALGLWSMSHMLSFILHSIFWELVIIGIPVAIGAILGWQWWKRIPEEERKGYHFFGKGSRSSRAGGAVSPLLFIAFAIKVYVDGNWNVAISTWSLDYVVGSMVTILAWIAAIFAVPAIIGIIWWIRHEMNIKP
jgi:hypothetical protein